MNRYTRDEILVRGLREADIPTLEATDAPNGIVQPNAQCIDWLHDALDIFYNEYPWASRITSASVTIATTGLASCPTDLILDVRNGLFITSPKQQVRRKPYPYIISVQELQDSSTLPTCYTIQRQTLIVGPLPKASIDAKLYYYARPALLDPNDVPDFPSDRILIDYVRIKALEFVRAVPPGSALEYAKKRVGELLTAGIGNEPEYDEIMMTDRVSRVGGSRYDWMGSTTI